MIIKILGLGCPTCQKLEENVKKAVIKVNIEEATIEKVTDYAKIAKYGVMQLPALVINEEVKLAGYVPKAAEIEKILNEYAKKFC